VGLKRGNDTRLMRTDVLFEPMALLEGGLTQIEIRAFAELGAMSGAARVYVWQGQELTAQQLSRLAFSEADGRLLFPGGR
jgi:rod shape-determining protein MreB and related proteins